MSDGGRGMVRLRDVRKSYVTGAVVTEVLRGVDLEIAAGEFIVVYGPSGCGKTTLLNLIGALDTPTSGSVVVDGRELERMGRAQLTAFRRETVGFVFQAYNLLPTLTAAENVEAALELLPAAVRGDVRRRALECLRGVGMEDGADKFPDQLSGGEQQRVAIARALSKRPQLVLADEPTGNIDEAMGARIIDVMRTLNAETGCTFVVVSHNPAVARRADRVLRLSGGRVVRDL